jgi:hypothetical protein
MHKWGEHFMVYSCKVHCLRGHLEAMGVGRPSVWGPSSNWILVTFSLADNRKGYRQCRTWRNVLVSRRNWAKRFSPIKKHPSHVVHVIYRLQQRVLTFSIYLLFRKICDRNVSSHLSTFSLDITKNTVSTEIHRHQKCNKKKSSMERS